MKSAAQIAHAPYACRYCKEMIVHHNLTALHSVVTNFLNSDVEFRFSFLSLFFSKGKD